MANITIKGLEQIFEHIEEHIDVEKIKRAMGKACALVEASAKKNAPKDTGALRNSITSEVKVEDGEVVGIVYTPLEYAPYIMCGA